MRSLPAVSRESSELLGFVDLQKSWTKAHSEIAREQVENRRWISSRKLLSIELRVCTRSWLIQQLSSSTRTFEIAFAMLRPPEFAKSDTHIIHVHQAIPLIGIIEKRVVLCHEALSCVAINKRSMLDLAQKWKFKPNFATSNLKRPTRGNQTHRCRHTVDWGS